MMPSRIRQSLQDKPTLDNPSVSARRVALLQQPHMTELNSYVLDLRERKGAAPWFDPVDGGSRAHLLVLLETPGPRIPEPRFVSRDNPSATARNLRRFLTAPRERTALWNAVPWIIHQPGARNRAPRKAEVEEGVAELERLLPHFPELRVVVLAGHIAARAEETLSRLLPHLPVLRMPHPSPTFVNTAPWVAEKIEETMLAAGGLMQQAVPKFQVRGPGEPPNPDRIE